MGERIVKEFPLTTGRTIRYFAEDVRRERTGIHAKITIGLDTTLLAWTNFNVERDEERLRLANSASKALGELDRAVWPVTDMKHALDLFCSGLWDAAIGQIPIGYRQGIRKLEGPSYALRPLVIDGGGTIIYAPPGRGKSFTALLMAQSMNAGTELLFPAALRRTLYINIERDAESMDDRLARVNSCLRLDDDAPLAFLHQRGKSLHDVYGSADRFCRTEGIEVVILDSISRSGYGDLNENQPVNKIVDAMNGLSRTWVALAHTPRQDESHVFGSVHFDAGMDIGVRLTTQSVREGLTVGVGLTVTKANDGVVTGKPLLFALEFDATGLADARGATNHEFPMLAPISAGNLVQRVDSLLGRVGWMSATELAKELGGSVKSQRVSEVLNADGEKYQARRDGKSVLYSLSV